MPITLSRSPMTDEQRAAAHSPEGPLIIIGGPNTGKTHLLVNRALVLAESGVDPNSITILTINTHTANEISIQMERLTGLPPAQSGFFVGTIHQFCATFLRSVGYRAASILPNFSVIGSAEEANVFKELLLSELGLDDSAPTLTPLQDSDRFLVWHSQLQNHDDTSPPPPPPEPGWLEIAQAFRQEKQAQNLLSFDDLVSYSLHALRNNPELRRSTAEVRTRHLLIDQFEDLTKPQHELIELLVGTTNSIAITYDPNQIIYSWRGATAALFENFKLRHPTATQVVLRHNHRATRHLSRLTDALKSSPLTPGLSRDHQITVRRIEGPNFTWMLRANNPDQQSILVADEILSLHDQHEIPWHDMAILYRHRHRGEAIGATLALKNIPFQINAPERRFDNPDAQSVLAMLRLTANPYTLQALKYAGLSRSQRELPNLPLVREIQSIQRFYGFHLIDACRKLASDPTANNARYLDTLNYITMTWDTLNQHLRDPAATPSTLMDLAWEEHLRHFPDGAIEPSEPIISLRAAAKGHIHEGPPPTPRSQLTGFLEALATGYNQHHVDQSTKDLHTPRNSVTLSLISASKGRHYPVVFLINLVETEFRGHVNPRAPHLALEAQRTFYVALTRATDRLYLCGYLHDSHMDPTQPSELLLPLNPPS